MARTSRGRSKRPSPRKWRASANRRPIPWRPNGCRTQPARTRGGVFQPSPRRSVRLSGEKPSKLASPVSFILLRIDKFKRRRLAKFCGLGTESSAPPQEADFCGCRRVRRRRVFNHRKAPHRSSSGHTTGFTTSVDQERTSPMRESFFRTVRHLCLPAISCLLLTFAILSGAVVRCGGRFLPPHQCRERAV